MVDFKPHKLVDTISALKNMHGIDRVLLSEEIFLFQSMAKIFGKILNNSNNKSYLI